MAAARADGETAPGWADLGVDVIDVDGLRDRYGYDSAVINRTLILGNDAPSGVDTVAPVLAEEAGVSACWAVALGAALVDRYEPWRTAFDDADDASAGAGLGCTAAGLLDDARGWAESGFTDRKFVEPTTTPARGGTATSADWRTAMCAAGLGTPGAMARCPGQAGEVRVVVDDLGWELAGMFEVIQWDTSADDWVTIGPDRSVAVGDEVGFVVDGVAYLSGLPVTQVDGAPRLVTHLYSIELVPWSGPTG